MTTRDTLLGTRRFSQDLPVAGATAGTPFEVIAFRAPIRMTTTAVRFLSDAAITGHAAAYATLSVVNRGASGVGTTEIASFAFDTPTTDDVIAYDEKAITLSATAANLVVAAGDLVTIKKTVATTGLALSGKVIIETTPGG